MVINQSTSRNSAHRKSTVKLQAQKINDFNGNEIKWKSWKKKNRAEIGSTGLQDIHESADEAEKIR